jgi:hypothetical protein
MRPFRNTILPTRLVTVIVAVVVVGVTFGFTGRYHPILDLAIITGSKTSGKNVFAVRTTRNRGSVTKGNHRQAAQ